MIKIYGIKNCDTMKKARVFLAQAGVEHQFIDYRADGLSQELLAHFVADLGWQALLNTKGTTYRALPDEQKADMTAEKAMALMLAQPALIKRPLLDINGRFYLGFKAEQYQQLVAGLK
ncbi:ArsC family reductase [Rheinheimera sp. 4Y26]|uniref:ArsC family reductase n=1 Tax=Rheinheimera sp. 4Y26 TaxID=2977811 RepID=UPI0021B0949A|nr:ArsC family reductase [Rheinheimera sp. 4Y26]MCT6699634.1 ArsC family reductase [Rheinheimera sp. 4Y26]